MNLEFCSFCSSPGAQAPAAPIQDGARAGESGQRTVLMLATALSEQRRLDVPDM